jgi:hypothetical protein
MINARLLVHRVLARSLRDARNRATRSILLSLDEWTESAGLAATPTGRQWRNGVREQFVMVCLLLYEVG